MKEIISDNYSIWIGNSVFSKINLIEYSKVAIIVDENTQKLMNDMLETMYAAPGIGLAAIQV